MESSFTQKYSKTGLMRYQFIVRVRFMLYITVCNVTTTILFFGVISPRKNVKLLVESFNLVSNSTDSYNFCLAGSIPEHYQQYGKEVTQKIHEYNLEDEIQITGYVDPDDISYYYKNSDIFVQVPKHRPSASGSISLAIKYRVPIVTTDLPYFRDYLNESCAEFVTPEATAISKGILKLTGPDSDELRENYSKELVNLSRKYSWENVAKDTLDIYSNYIDS